MHSLAAVAAVSPSQCGALPDPTRRLGSHVPTFTVSQVLDRARTSPHAAAIRDASGRTLSLGDLATASVALGAALTGAGVRRGDVVAIWSARAMSLPWAMLGTWCAGGAFTVLDSGYPAARLVASIAIARPKALLALDAAGPVPDEVVDALAAIGCDTIIQLPDAPADAWLSQTAHPAILDALTAADAAYVAFTSGTTGQPKGIVAGHAPLAHFLDWHRRTFELGVDDRFVMMSGLAHDPLLRSIFTPLTCGGTLIVPDAASLRDPTALRALLSAEGATVLHLTPSLGRLLAHGAEFDPICDVLPDIRRIFFAGETLYKSTVQKVRIVALNAQCVNFYGATETPQAMGFWEIDDEQLEDESSCAAIPVGHGIDDVQLLVVDAQGNRVGVGVPGEICVRTAFLSHGYIDLPGETAAKFIVNTATGDPRDRMYRTGDLGAYAADGSVTALGRADRQLKVRGFRVELDEIEATIGENPRVRHVTVNAEVRTDDSDRRIIAHIAAGPELSASAIRSALRARLPEYMIPSRIMVMPSLPLTANGKVDRDALLKLTDHATPISAGESKSDNAADFRDIVERRLAAVWRDVLDAPRLARDDSFFDLGGNSLLGLDLLLRIEREFGRQLPTQTLLLTPTVASMSELLREDRDTTASLLVPIRPGGSAPPVFWLPGGGGLSVIAFRGISERIDADRPIYGLEADLDIEQAPTTLPAIVRAYREAIQAVQPHGPYHLFGFSLGSFVAYELAVQFRAIGEEVALLVVFDTEVPGTSGRWQRLRIATHRIMRAVGSLLRPGADRAPMLGNMRSRLVGLATPRPSEVPPTDTNQSVFERIRLRNIAAVHAYAATPLPEFDGRVTCVLARETSKHGLAASIDPRLAWHRTATRGIDVHSVGGNHLSMLEPPHVDELAGVLNGCLARA